MLKKYLEAKSLLLKGNKKLIEAFYNLDTSSITYIGKVTEKRIQEVLKLKLKPEYHGNKQQKSSLYRTLINELQRYKLTSIKANEREYHYKYTTFGKNNYKLQISKGFYENNGGIEISVLNYEGLLIKQGMYFSEKDVLISSIQSKTEDEFKVLFRDLSTPPTHLCFY